MSKRPARAAPAGTTRKRVIGLFVEGSRTTDPLRDDFVRMWQRLAAHCDHEDVELHVIGINKGNIVELRDLTPGASPTQLAKGATQGSGGKDPLDIVIQREHQKCPFDRVIIAFDLWKPNQRIPPHEQDLPCPMRPEAAFVLEKLAASARLDGRFKRDASDLLQRYRSSGQLRPRDSVGSVEVLFMEPMFEALFVADEPTVRKALGVAKKLPKDWPRFKTHDPALDKVVIDPAIRAATGKRHPYLNAKARWGYTIVSAAGPGAALWTHPIAQRLCRVLAA